MLPTNATFLKSSTLIEQCPAPDKPEFAFIGRSNVGKSSLINMLVNKKNMAKTSGTPGKTRLINHFEITSNSGSWYLVDLPGYGYDKEKPGAVERNVNAFCAKLLEQFAELPNIFVTSATERTGRERLLGFIGQSIG